MESKASILLVWLIQVSAGFALLRWGKRLPRSGDWLAGSVISAGMLTAILNPDAEPWTRGWLWARDVEPSNMGISILLDWVGLSWICVTYGLIASLFLFTHRIADEDHPERIYSALTLSSAGIALTWVAGTPWLVVSGVLVTAIGSFVGMGSRWSTQADADLAGRMIREKSVALLVSSLGAAVYAAGGSALGAALLVAGGMLFSGTIPFLGLSVMQSKHFPPARFFLQCVAPFICSVAALIRLEPILIPTGALEALGWFAVSSGLVLALQGLSQRNWSQALFCWMTAGGNLVIAALCWGSPWVTHALALSLVFSGSAICYFGSVASRNALKGWGDFLSWWLPLVSTGIFGSLAAVGTTYWIVQTDMGAAAYLIGPSWLILSTLAWRVVFLIRKSEQESSEQGWVGLAIPQLLSLAALALPWTGRIAGGLVEDEGDRLFASLLNFISGDGWLILDWSDPVSWFPQGSLVVSAFLGVWITRRDHDTIDLLSERAPRLLAFVAGGFGLDQAWGKLLFALRWFGRAMERWVEDSIWGRWLPGGLFALVRAFSRLVSWIDSRAVSTIESASGRGIQASSRLVRLVHSGDVQWYLLFGFGFIIVLLVHFLRVGG